MTQSAKKLEIETRLERELELKRKGWHYRQIASELGVAVGTVHGDIVRALKRAAVKNDGRTAEWRELELQKLDALEQATYAVLERKHIVLYQGVPVRIYPGECAGPEDRPLDVIDDAPVLNAVATLLRIAERRARLLGLDAPTKVQPTGEDGGPVRIIVEYE